MSWVKLDDSFFTHRKVVGLTKDAKLFFLASLALASSQMTDGVLSDGSIRTVAGMLGIKAKTASAELVTAGLWHTVGHGCDSDRCETQPPAGGYLIHDYLEYQPPAVVERARKDAARERTAKWRAKKGNRDGDGDESVTRHVRNAYADGALSPYPTPYPTTNPDPVTQQGAPDMRVGSGQTDLTERVAAACTGRKRNVVHDEAETVVAHLLAHVDRRLIEEALGQAAHDKPALPRWFIPAVRGRAQRHGITIPTHPIEAKIA